MVAKSPRYKMLVSGPLACFTRPELRVERVSYEVPTPSALEGMLKCIYWKPAFRYVIDKIIVFNPIKTICIKRNELKNKIPVSKINNYMKGKNVDLHIYTGRESERAQRTTTALKDVLYGIEFHLEMTGFMSFEKGDCIKKHMEILEKRFSYGRSFKDPYFGCSEFAADYWELVEEFPLQDISESLKGTRCPGTMLYGLKFPIERPEEDTHEGWVKQVWDDRAEAIYYTPLMVNGIIDVEKWRPAV